MRLITFSRLLAVVLFFAATACTAESADGSKQRMGSGDPVAGQTESVLCQGCHGAEGISFVDLIPDLAGQQAPYIAKQLRDFQFGARTHQVMSPISKTIGDPDLADIASYFASLKKTQGDGSGGNPVAAKLFLKGDPARGIPACASCHGANGKAPVIATYPVIGEQHQAYLRIQLLHWRSGDRSNSPDGVMNRAAKNLSDGEIDALADYLSGL
ncbi:MAG: c-type cytochrome [Gallionella sp.]